MRFRLAAVLLLFGVSLLGCSSDDDGGGEDAASDTAAPDADDSDADDAEEPDQPDEGDADAFCALLAASADEDVDPTTDEGRAMMAEILEAAPAELQPDIAAIFDAIEQLEAVDEDDPEAFSEALELVFDPEFVAAGEALETYAVDECGLPPGTISGEGEGDGDADDGDEDDPLDSDAIEAWLDENYAGDDWLELVQTRFSTPAGIGVGGDFSEEQALAACEALVDYLDEVGADSTVLIQDMSDTVVDTSTGECAPV